MQSRKAGGRETKVQSQAEDRKKAQLRSYQAGNESTQTLLEPLQCGPHVAKCFMEAIFTEPWEVGRLRGVE